MAKRIPGRTPEEIALNLTLLFSVSVEYMGRGMPYRGCKRAEGRYLKQRYFAKKIQRVMKEAEK